MITIRNLKVKSMNINKPKRSIEELKKIVEQTRIEFEEKPSIMTGRRYGDALNELSEALNEQQKREPQ